MRWRVEKWVSWAGPRPQYSSYEARNILQSIRRQSKLHFRRAIKIYMIIKHTAIRYNQFQNFLQKNIIWICYTDTSAV